MPDIPEDMGEEGTPEVWKTGTIIKLPKKGDLGNYNNIDNLVIDAIKIFSRLILKRIPAATDTKLRQEQAGFRRGKSCIDHIFRYGRFWNKARNGTVRPTLPSLTLTMPLAAFTENTCGE